MFTGIVRSTGHVAGIARHGTALELTLGTGGLATGGWRVGDSVCVAGVCLTIERVSQESFVASVSPETLARTTLGGLAEGDAVNLEAALAAGAPLGGHYVTGHVDGVARVEAVGEHSGSLAIAMGVPAELARFIAPRGSLTLDGVSLTVNEATGRHCRVTVIPHTRAVTTLGAIRAGQACNLEVDILARYVARLLDAGQPP